MSTKPLWTILAIHPQHKGKIKRNSIIPWWSLVSIGQIIPKSMVSTPKYVVDALHMGIRTCSLPLCLSMTISSKPGCSIGFYSYVERRQIGEWEFWSSFESFHWLTGIWVLRPIQDQGQWSILILMERGTTEQEWICSTASASVHAINLKQYILEQFQPEKTTPGCSIYTRAGSAAIWVGAE